MSAVRAPVICLRFRGLSRTVHRRCSLVSLRIIDRTTQSMSQLPDVLTSLSAGDGVQAARHHNAIAAQIVRCAPKTHAIAAQIVRRRRRARRALHEYRQTDSSVCTRGAPRPVRPARAASAAHAPLRRARSAPPLSEGSVHSRARSHRGAHTTPTQPPLLVLARSEKACT